MRIDKKEQAGLVNAAKNGSTDAFARLYGQIRHILYYYALSNLGSPEDAADAVQDAVLDAFCSIGELKKPGAFEGWIFRILTAKIMQKRKEYALRPASIEEIGELAAEPQLKKCELLEELAELSENERICITLKSIGGFSCAEIAKQTGLKSSSVRSCISRGRSRLRQMEKK